MSDQKVDAVTQEALDEYTKGNAHNAYRILKVSKGLALKEAKELLDSLKDKIVKGDGLRADEEEALKEAMDTVSVFDELTLLMIRHLRDTKQPICTAPPNDAYALEHCRKIYDSMRALIATDVNPSRALNAYIFKVEHDPMKRKLTDNDADLEVMRESFSVRLRDDILTLL